MPLSLSAHFWNYSHLPSCQGAGVNTILWPRQETYMPSYLLPLCSWSFLLSPIDPLPPSLFWTNLWHCTSYCLQVFPASSASPTLLYSSTGGSFSSPQYHLQLLSFPMQTFGQYQVSHLYHSSPSVLMFSFRISTFSYRNGRIGRAVLFCWNVSMVTTNCFFNPCKIIAAANQILHFHQSINNSLPIPKSFPEIMQLGVTFKHCSFTLQQRNATDL